jgi:hypothetical protein
MTGSVPLVRHSPFALRLCRTEVPAWALGFSQPRRFARSSRYELHPLVGLRLLQSLTGPLRYPPRGLRLAADSSLSWAFFPFDARGLADPLLRSLPRSVRCAPRASHPLSALLPASPSGLVSYRWRPWGFTLQSFSLSRSRATSRWPSALLAVAVFPSCRRYRSRALPPGRSPPVSHWKEPATHRKNSPPSGLFSPRKSVASSRRFRPTWWPDALLGFQPLQGLPLRRLGPALPPALLSQAWPSTCSLTGARPFAPSSEELFAAASQSLRERRSWPVSRETDIPS